MIPRPPRSTLFPYTTLSDLNMNASIAQCRYLLSLAEPILAGLDDSHCALEPQPGTKTAGWLVGHLAVSGDFARDRKSTRLNSSHTVISYAVFCLKKKRNKTQ